MTEGPLTKRIKERKIRQEEQRAAEEGKITELQRLANQKMAEEISRKMKEAESKTGKTTGPESGS